MAKGKKTGGRRPGSLNKRTTVLEKCEAIGLDPFQALAEIANDKMHEHQFLALKELCQYVEPKRKAVEVSGGMDVRVQQELESLMGLSEEEIKKLLLEALKK